MTTQPRIESAPGTGQVLTRKITRAFAVQAVGAALAFALQLALARWMGARGFGLYAYSMAWISLLSLVVGLGLPSGVVRFVPEYLARGEVSSVLGFIRFSSRAAIGAGAVFLTLAVTVAVAAGAVRTGKFPLILVAAALVPLFSLSTLQAETARALGAVARAYAPTLVVRPLTTVALAYVVAQRARLTPVVALGLSAAAYLFVLVLQRRVIRQLKPSSSIPLDRPENGREWIRVSFMLALTSGFVLLLTQTDLIVVGSLLGSHSAGLYAAASKTAALVGLVVVAANVPAAPRFAALHAAFRRRELEEAAQATVRWIFFPAMGLGLMLAIPSRFILGFFGHEYLAANWPLRILVLGQLASAAAGSVGYLLATTGHHRDAARIYGVCALVNVAAVSCGVVAGGVLGAAIGTTLSTVIWNIWLRAVVVRRLSVRPSIIEALFAPRTPATLVP